MEEFLSVFRRRMLKSLAVCTLMVSITLIAAGQGYLIGALFVGYMAAGVCMWVLVYRTWKSSMLDVSYAKKQMMIGLILRLGTAFVVFWTAIQISVSVFWAVVSGFLLFSMLTMVHMIVLAHSQADRNR